MSKRAESFAMQYGYYDKGKKRACCVGYNAGYKQAQKDTIEMACQLLYDYNRQMAEMYGEKAVLSCSQFTIDVERFRKTLIIE